MSEQADSDDDPKAGATAPASSAEPKPEEPKTAESKPEASKAEASKAEDKPRRASASASARSGKTGHKSSRGRDQGTGKEKSGASQNSQRAVLLAVLGLAAGAAGGWFGHEAQAKAKLASDSAPAPSGSGAAAGPCGGWRQKICASSGETSAACEQAKGAADLLPTSACEAALESVPATLAKIKAARASCDKLVAKLCKEVPEGSATCGMVKERSASFPSQRCEEMLANYDQVAGEIRMIEQQGALQQGAPPHGAPPIAMPAGVDESPQP